MTRHASCYARFRNSHFLPTQCILKHTPILITTGMLHVRLVGMRCRMCAVASPPESTDEERRIALASSSTSRRHKTPKPRNKPESNGLPTEVGLAARGRTLAHLRHVHLSPDPWPYWARTHVHRGSPKAPPAALDGVSACSPLLVTRLALPLLLTAAEWKLASTLARVRTPLACSHSSAGGGGSGEGSVCTHDLGEELLHGGVVA